MGDAWDADDFDVPEIDYKRPEEIAAEEQAKAAAAAAEAEAKEKAAQSAQAKKGVKAKATKGDYDSSEPQRELTAKEREELQKKNDLGLARDLFGGEGEEDTLTNLDNEKEFIEYADKLASKLTSRQKAEHYPAFVQHLMYKLCTDMESKNVRKLSTELKALADMKANEEKSKKTSSKPTIKPAAAKSLKAGGNAKMYDDFLDGSGGGGGDYGYDDDDFM